MSNDSSPRMKPAIVFSVITHFILFSGFIYITLEKKPTNISGTPDGKAMTVVELLKGDGGDPSLPDRLVTSAAPPSADKRAEAPAKQEEDAAPAPLPEPPAPEPPAKAEETKPEIEKSQPEVVATPAATPEPVKKPEPKPEKKPEVKKQEDDAKVLELNRKKEEEKKEAEKKETEKKDQQKKEQEKKLAEKKEQEKIEAEKKAQEKKEQEDKIAEQKAKELAATKAKNAALTPEQAAKLRPAPSNPALIHDKNGTGAGGANAISKATMASLMKAHGEMKAGGRFVAGAPAGSGLPGGGGPANGGKGGGNPLGQATQGPTSLKGLGLSDNYAKEALARVARYFVVPPDKEKEASTVVGLTISRSGTLSNIRVNKSCGSRELDEIALSALESTKNFPPFPDGFDKDTADVEISFAFQD